MITPLDNPLAARFGAVDQSLGGHGGGNLPSQIPIAGSPALNKPLRTRQEVALDMLLESLEAIDHMAHEQKVVEYARRQLARAYDILNA